MDGRVKISRVTDDGHQVVIDIYRPDEFFGESALLNLPDVAEQAAAMEVTKLMTWTTSQIEEIVTRRPRLGIALSQMFVRRIMDFTDRIKSLTADTVDRQLARSLIRFSERFGTPGESGSVHMMPLTHELLSQYVGTSREIITHYLIRFRREGYLQYSRKGIILYREALREWLRQNT
jgi:CRP/FNR family transcriptional regulator